jgi:GNAT superfamily N-acetyltransferase
MKRIAGLSDAQIDELVELFQDLWWTKGRDRAGVERMLAGSLVIGFEDAEDRLAGFARAISDGVYKALILDVVVAPRHRGSGLGRALIDTILSHPDLAEIECFELYCAPDMVPFYEMWGFTAELGTLTFMRRGTVAWS